MHNNFVNFCTDENGAVTVDWVVLTAAIIGLGGAVMVSTSQGTMSLANLTSAALSDTMETTLSAEEFLAGYVAIYEAHDHTDVDGVTWANKVHKKFNGETDADVLNRYDNYYTNSATGEDPKAADYLLVVQQIMDERGIDAPGGDLTSAEIRALYE